MWVQQGNPVSPKKNSSQPLALDAKCLLWAFDAVAVWVSPEQTRIFSAVPHHPSLPPQKKVSEKNLHFLHQAKKSPIKPELFRCRIGCRILLSLESYPTPPAPFCLISRVNRENSGLHTNLLAFDGGCLLWAIGIKTLDSRAVLCCIRGGMKRKKQDIEGKKREKQGE